MTQTTTSKLVELMHESFITELILKTASMAKFFVDFAVGIGIPNVIQGRSEIKIKPLLLFPYFKPRKNGNGDDENAHIDINIEKFSIPNTERQSWNRKTGIIGVVSATDNELECDSDIVVRVSLHNKPFRQEFHRFLTEIEQNGESFFDYELVVKIDDNKILFEKGNQIDRNALKQDYTEEIEPILTKYKQETGKDLVS